MRSGFGETLDGKPPPPALASLEKMVLRYNSELKIAYKTYLATDGAVASADGVFALSTRQFWQFLRDALHREDDE